jgi:hypothetical protein
MSSTSSYEQIKNENMNMEILFDDHELTTHHTNNMALVLYESYYRWIKTFDCKVEFKNCPSHCFQLPLTYEFIISDEYQEIKKLYVKYKSFDILADDEGCVYKISYYVPIHNTNKKIILGEIILAKFW